MKITLTEITMIPSGVALKLTDAQLDARRHAVEPFEDKKNVWVGTQAFTFKAGETIEIMGDLPKGILPVYDQELSRKKDSKQAAA